VERFETVGDLLENFPTLDSGDGALVPWSLRENVAGPIEILLASGADPFSAKYDAWVLQTVLYEIPLSLAE
jgi:hypothetical protein